MSAPTYPVGPRGWGARGRGEGGAGGARALGAAAGRARGPPRPCPRDGARLAQPHAPWASCFPQARAAGGAPAPAAPPAASSDAPRQRDQGGAEPATEDRGDEAGAPAARARRKAVPRGRGRGRAGAGGARSVAGDDAPAPGGDGVDTGVQAPAAGSRESEAGGSSAAAAVAGGKRAAGEGAERQALRQQAQQDGSGSDSAIGSGRGLRPRRAGWAERWQPRGPGRLAAQGPSAEAAAAGEPLAQDGGASAAVAASALQAVPKPAATSAAAARRWSDVVSSEEGKEGQEAAQWAHAAGRGRGASHPPQVWSSDEGGGGDRHSGPELTAPGGWGPVTNGVPSSSFGRAPRGPGGPTAASLQGLRHAISQHLGAGASGPQRARVMPDGDSSALSGGWAQDSSGLSGSAGWDAGAPAAGPGGGDTFAEPGWPLGRGQGDPDPDPGDDYYFTAPPAEAAAAWQRTKEPEPRAPSLDSDGPSSSADDGSEGAPAAACPGPGTREGGFAPLSPSLSPSLDDPAKVAGEMRLLLAQVSALLPVLTRSMVAQLEGLECELEETRAGAAAERACTAAQADELRAALAGAEVRLAGAAGEAGELRAVLADAEAARAAAEQRAEAGDAALARAGAQVAQLRAQLDALWRAGGQRSPPPPGFAGGAPPCAPPQPQLQPRPPAFGDFGLESPRGDPLPAAHYGDDPGAALTPDDSIVAGPAQGPARGGGPPPARPPPPPQGPSMGPPPFPGAYSHNNSMGLPPPGSAPMAPPYWPAAGGGGSGGAGCVAAAGRPPAHAFAPYHDPSNGPHGGPSLLPPPMPMPMPPRAARCSPACRGPGPMMPVVPHTGPYPGAGLLPPPGATLHDEGGYEMGGSYAGYGPQGI
jgi:hypothetical protein